MSARMEAAFALAQHNAYVSMRNDPGIWNDSLRRALEGVLPMVWLEAQAEARAALEAARDPEPAEREMRCPGCDCYPVGYAPHNGKGDCPPKPSDPYPEQEVVG